MPSRDELGRLHQIQFTVIVVVISTVGGGGCGLVLLHNVHVIHLSTAVPDRFCVDAEDHLKGKGRRYDEC